MGVDDWIAREYWDKGEPAPTQIMDLARDSQEYKVEEQPRPSGSGPHIADLVCEDILKRKEAGTLKYGQPLMANNGRNAILDAYEEALDLCVYLRQAYEESCQ